MFPGRHLRSKKPEIVLERSRCRRYNGKLDDAEFQLIIAGYGGLVPRCIRRLVSKIIDVSAVQST